MGTGGLSRVLLEVGLPWVTFLIASPKNHITLLNICVYVFGVCMGCKVLTHIQ